VPIAAFYAAILAILFIVLSVRTMLARRTAQVEIGHGENRELFRRGRVHANFAEYAPLALLLIGLAESLSASPALLHAAGGVLTAGRLAHAYGLSQEPHNLMFRAGGMTLTLGAIALAAGMCFALSAGRVF
jgi:uncharacterized membrane protein YecN with MAPEG domain